MHDSESGRDDAARPRPQAVGRAERSARWQWWVAGLLLLATMLNYMDRQTLANLSVRITRELSLTEERYGELEMAFGWAFAVGSIFFGLLADRLPVRWLYPAVVIGWSAVGMLSGFAGGYASMLTCRTLLGFFESGHWPCALKTTQAVLARRHRMLGNSLLQSGGAIGAILTPLVIRAMVGENQAAGAWRPPFVVIGGIGAAWVFAWLATIRADDLAGGAGTPGTAPPAGAPSLLRTWWDACLTNRRFWALVPMVVCINIVWHLLRVWLPKFLQQGRGASEAESLFFNSAYYVAADIGCIAAGAASLWLVRRGMAVHRSRLVVVAVCAAGTALTTVAATLPRGGGMYAALLVIGAAAMGLFPCYYSLAQEVSPRHLGLSTGLLASIGWLVSAPMQKAFGRLVDRTGSFDVGIGLAGLAPVLAFALLLAIWPREQPHDETAGGGR
jgi:ACS family hexuronate transporter-like MFS transporter